LSSLQTVCARCKKFKGLNLRNAMPMLHPEQKRIYQSMTPEEKLRIAMDLFHCAWDLKLAGLRAQHPDWSENEIEEKVREIFLYART